MTRVARALSCAALVLAPFVLGACGGRAHAPLGVPLRGTASPSGGSGAGVSSPASSNSGHHQSAVSSPSSEVSGTTNTTARPTPSTHTSALAPGPVRTAISTAYGTYLLDLSGLDDNLNKVWVDRIATVTTNRLGQASVRQAAALLAAQEHGVGQLRDDHVNIVMTGPSSAAVADCQDEFHFYLVNDNSGTPDPFIDRGYFVGSAQMLLQDGKWLVDVFTTTHATCAY